MFYLQIELWIRLRVIDFTYSPRSTTTSVQNLQIVSKLKLINLLMLHSLMTYIFLLTIFCLIWNGKNHYYEKIQVFI
jgi:hypothetical protein